MTEREKIVETVNKLFVYTDEQNWRGLQDDVFTENVFLDMTSLRGAASDVTAKEICDNWRQGFKELDAVNHLAGNYLITLSGDHDAEVHAYATATHYKESAKNGTTREFVGTYDIRLSKNSLGWRIHTLKYNLKYTQGNMLLD
jgi:hypothetical protein